MQHAWLFAWKNATVFQAGPSRAQNWFDTKGTGNVISVGTRSGGDAMCGVNVMYDIGKILSTGKRALPETLLLLQLQTYQLIFQVEAKATPTALE